MNPNTARSASGAAVLKFKRGVHSADLHLKDPHPFFKSIPLPRECSWMRIQPHMNSLVRSQPITRIRTEHKGEPESSKIATSSQTPSGTVALDQSRLNKLQRLQQGDDLTERDPTNRSMGLGTPAPRESCPGEDAEVCDLSSGIHVGLANEVRPKP